MSEGKGNKLPLTTYISFSFAGAASYMLYQIVANYQTVFYTDVAGLTAGAVATILLISKIWDAINDPMMGIIAERTKSRWGRFRPYLLWMAPVSSITLVLTFVVWPGSPATKAVISGICYILFGMAYTAAGIPMQSMPTVMTRNNNERVKLYSAFGIASQIGGLVVSAVFTPALLKFGKGDVSSPKAYLYICIIFGVLACIASLTAFAGTKEVIQGSHKSQKISVKESYRIFVKDKNILLLLAGMILALTGVFGRIGLAVYYYMYVLERVDLVPVCISLQTFGMLVPYFFLPIFIKRFDIKKILSLSAIICAGACILLFFSNGNTVLILIGTFILGAGNWLTLGSQTIVSQIIDDNEVKNGFRTEGILVSAISFSTKFASAIGSAIGVLLITAVGYIPNAVQTVSAKSGMNAVINIGPAVLYIIAAIVFMLIKMSNKKAEENTELLSSREVEEEIVEA